MKDLGYPALYTLLVVTAVVIAHRLIEGVFPQREQVAFVIAFMTLWRTFVLDQNKEDKEQ
jgi:hypothetical protein